MVKVGPEGRRRHADPADPARAKFVLASAPQPQYPAEIDFGGRVIYLSFDLSTKVIAPGTPVQLTQYWKVVSPPGPGWHSDTQIRGRSDDKFLPANDSDPESGLPPEQPGAPGAGGRAGGTGVDPRWKLTEVVLAGN